MRGILPGQRLKFGKLKSKAVGRYCGNKAFANHITIIQNKMGLIMLYVGMAQK